MSDKLHNHICHVVNSLRAKQNLRTLLQLSVVSTTVNSLLSFMNDSRDFAKVVQLVDTIIKKIK